MAVWSVSEGSVTSLHLSRELELENANLKEEYNHLKIVGCQMPSLAGAALFASVHQWELPTGLYFVLSSISTVGFGDVVPEDSVVYLMAGGYILLGMALFSLWQVRDSQ